MATVSERIKFLPKADRAKVVAGVGLLGGVILLIYGLNMTRFYYDIDDSTVFTALTQVVFDLAAYRIVQPLENICLEDLSDVQQIYLSMSLPFDQRIISQFFYLL